MKKRKKWSPHEELNPDLLGERQLSLPHNHEDWYKVVPESCNLIINENFMNFTGQKCNFANFQKAKTPRLSAVLSTRPSLFNSILRILLMISMLSSHLRAPHGNSNLKLSLLYKETRKCKNCWEPQQFWKNWLLFPNPCGKIRISCKDTFNLGNAEMPKKQH